MLDRPSLLARPVFGYLFLALLGVFFLWTGRNLPMGSLMQIGPGFVPTVLAAILLIMAIAGIMGEVLRLSWWQREGGASSIDWPSLAYVSLAILVFAASVRSIGLIPATFATCAVAALADRRTPPWAIVLLAIAAGMFAWLVFIVGLELSIAAFRIPR